MDQDPTQPFEPPAEPVVPGQPQPTESVTAQPAPAAPAAPAQPATPSSTAAEPSPWARPVAPAPVAPVQDPLPPASPWSTAPGSAVQPPAPPAQYGAPGPAQPYGAGSSFGAPARPSVGPATSYGGSVPPTGLDVSIAPVAGRPRRRNPLRYVVAALVVVLVVASGIGATMLLTGSSGGSSALAGYAPADSILYAEGRLDLPGSQRAAVAKALAALPGFADQAALNAKLGELFDRVMRAATSNKHDYQTEIAPWFGGQIAVAQGPQAGFAGMTPFPGMSPAAPSPTISPTASLPACTGGDTATPQASPSTASGLGAMSVSIRALVLANVTDTAKAGAWVNSILGDTSAKTTDRTCDGVVVHVVQTPSGYTGAPDAGWAILGDKVLAIGDLASIRLAIATKGTAGLSGVAAFQKATASLPGDHVGMLYESVQAMFKAQLDGLARAAGAGTGDAADAAAAFSVLADLMPEWVAGDLKASNGNFVLDTVQPKTDYQSATNRTSDLAGLAPANTIALLDTHDLGKMLGSLKDKFAANPKLATYVKQLDDALNLAGGFSGTIGWIGDAGFAVTRDGSKVSGGIVIRPDDAGAATRLVTQLRALADLGGASSGLAFKDDVYKGVKISSLDLSAMAPLLESSMGSSGMAIPSNLQFVYAVTDKVVVLTLDSSFARAVIDASQGGDSLAKNTRFSSLLNQAGAQNAGLAWLDLTATRELVEGILPASERIKYETDVRPYLLPFDALVTVNVVDGDLLRGTMTLAIKH